MRYFFLFVVLLFACTTKQPNPKNNKKPSVLIKKIESKSQNKSIKPENLWVDQFKEFRLALFHNDKKTLDKFFDFPIQSDKNELWILIDEKGFESFEENQDKPISKELFYKNIDKIFPKEFIQLLLKVKSDSLRFGKEYEISTKDDLEQLFFSFSESSLSIIHNFVFMVEDENGQLDEDTKTESAKIYYFEINKSGKLKFKSVTLAG